MIAIPGLGGIAAAAAMIYSLFFEGVNHKLDKDLMQRLL
jgi:hypothetical protein